MRADRRRTHSLAEGDLLRRVAVRDLVHDAELTLRQRERALRRPAWPHERGEQPAGEDAEQEPRDRAMVHAVRDGADLRPVLARLSERALRAAHDLVAVLLEEELAAAARAVRLTSLVPDGCDRLGHGRVGDAKLLGCRLTGTGRDKNVPAAVAAEVAVELSTQGHGLRLQFHPFQRGTGPPCSASRTAPGGRVFGITGYEGNRDSDDCGDRR